MNKLILIFALATMLLSPSALLAAAAVSGSVSTTTTKAAVTEMDERAIQAMVRPMLESYAKKHPNIQVQIWSLIVLSNLDEIEKEQLFSLPTIIQQVGSKDENIRLIAIDTLRQSLKLDQEEWQGVLAPVLRNTAKTSKYIEVRRIAIKAIGALPELDEKEMSSIPLLLELAQDDDAEIRKVALETIGEILAKQSSGGGGGGGAPVGGYIGPPR